MRVTFIFLKRSPPYSGKNQILKFACNLNWQFCNFDVQKDGKYQFYMNVLNLSKCLHDKMKNCNVVVSCFAIPKPLKLNKNVENCTQTLLGWELFDISDLSYFLLLQT